MSSGRRTSPTTATQLGITTPLQPYFSIGLGAEPATPLEMARAYATLANGGYRLDNSLFRDEPLAIKSITDAERQDRSRTRPSASPCPGSPATTRRSRPTSCRASSRTGTGTAAQLPGWPVAGKTGTTENYGDAWFVGYTPDLVTAVWVGYPNKLIPMLTEYHGKPVVGGTYPALIWKAFMTKALAYRKLTPTSFPSALIAYASPATGACSATASSSSTTATAAARR